MSRAARRSGVVALVAVAAAPTALVVADGAGATVATVEVSTSANATSSTSANATTSTLVVDTLDDGVATPTDCTAPVDRSCSLRDALAAAADGDAIEFAPGLTGTITSTQGTFTISRSVTITGPGPDALVVHGDGAHRVFLVADTAVDVTMSGLTVTGGTNGVGDGGGGGIRAVNTGSFTVRDCSVSGNTTTDKGAAGIFFGNLGAAVVEGSTIDANVTPWWTGGLYFGGYDRSITVVDSTISNNHAAGGGGGIGLWGDRNTVLIANSTIVGNSSGDYGGGGVLAYDGHTITVVMSTITDNTALGDDEGRAGGFESFAADMLDHIPIPATVTIVGTILSGNHSGHAATADLGAWGDPKATITVSDSLLGAGASFLDGGGIVRSSVPGLAPLGANGGRTRTMALLDGSPAIDAGPVTVPVFPGNEWDQRGAGFRRIVGGRVDIGAFERQAVPAPVQPIFTG